VHDMAAGDLRNAYGGESMAHRRYKVWGHEGPVSGVCMTWGCIAQSTLVLRGKEKQIMSVRKIGFMMPCVAIVLAVSLAFTQGCGGKAAEEPTEKLAAAVKVTLTGTNFCLGCALKKEKGAGAQCSTFGHKHALDVINAVDEDGKELPGLRGWVLHYLETEKSQELITNHHGETLTINGSVYPLERVLEMDSYEVSGG